MRVDTGCVYIQRMKRIPHEDEWGMDHDRMTNRVGWTFLVMWMLGFVAGWVAGKFV